MRLQVLIELSLILTSYSKGTGWEVNVTNTINATHGENVTVNCTYKYPIEQHTEDVELHWKLNQKIEFKFKDNDQNAFLFHPNETYIVEKYRGRTQLIGEKTKGNCSLKILNITTALQNIYLRIIAKNDYYSFRDYRVSIILSGVKPDINQDNISEALPTETPTLDTTSVIWYNIFIPVAVGLIIILVIGIVYCKHKRSISLTREDSGYYANFTRTSSNQAKRKELGRKQHNIEPELKAFDEPVYINLEAPAGQMDQHMDQSMDHTDSIYANMDYSK